MAMILLKVISESLYSVIFFQVKNRDFHRCKKNGTWQKPEKVVIFCKANGQSKMILFLIDL